MRKGMGGGNCGKRSDDGEKRPVGDDGVQNK